MKNEQTKPTVFQRLQQVLGGGTQSTINRVVGGPRYNIQTHDPHQVIATASSEAERNQLLSQHRQQALLAKQWKKTQYDLTNKQLIGLNELRFMYVDCDLMDNMPEIGAALDITAEEVCSVGEDGQMIKVTSNSERVKGVLEDLFTNRLVVNTTLPMVARSTCKYGNTYMQLNLSATQGVLGWTQLPVKEIERYDNGMKCPYDAQPLSSNLATVDEKRPDDTKFIWIGSNNEYIPFRNWQIAHFRLLYDSQYLPYGVSFLNKARRHFRMLSMMEDMMLVYRLDRSMERRIFNIDVGNIDEQDVPAYIDEIANNFKRAPIVDPTTGQVDLRKNILPVWKNTPIPLLDGRTITIEQLSNELKNGKTNYVYSIQDGTHKIVAGKVVWCDKNYTAKQLIKITLDDGTYMVMAPEHEIIMRDGSKKRADQVATGESVMPFYREINPQAEKYIHRYEKIYNPNTGKFEYTHRLIAQEIKKSDNKYNTVHHKDFNKYNNSPTNLVLCDFHKHHKMHSDLIKREWKNKEKREIRCKRLSDSMKKYYAEHPVTDEMRTRISKTIRELYNNEEIREQRVAIFNQTVDAWRHSKELFELTRRRNIAEESWRRFIPYNHSELHTQHNQIRRQNKLEFWKDEEKATIARKKMPVEFDDFIWNALRMAIVKGFIYNRTTLINYINTHLIDHLCEINTNEQLHKNGFISRNVVQSRIRELGFPTISSYISAIKKNHKIQSVEYITGDDVYCMTVVGEYGENDRHNFALRTFINDTEWSDSGCFVSNCSTDDFFIPRRPGDTSTKIETLSAGQNLTAMDDVKYMQNKVVTALRVPKAFLNFEDNKGDGKNLSMLDVRFSRTINRIQQTLLLELNKIAIIHLYLLGFTDELTQFKLSMRNPSSQAEMLEIENLAKKVTTAKDAVSDPGTGIPLVSMTWALKHIMKFSNKEIQQVLEELRLESALAAELQKTAQIIKRTGLFDPVDNIYGESGAEYTEDNPEGDGGEVGPMGGGGGGGLAMGGGDFDFGEGEEMGAEGEMPMDDAAAAGAPEPADDNGPAPAIGEAIIRIANKKATDKIKKADKQSLVREIKQRETEITSLIEQLSKRYPDQDGSEALFGSVKPVITENNDKVEPFYINEEMNHLIENVKKFAQDGNE